MSKYSQLGWSPLSETSAGSAPTSTTQNRKRVPIELERNRNFSLGIHVYVENGLIVLMGFKRGSICENKLRPGDITSISSIDDTVVESALDIKTACTGGKPGTDLVIEFTRPPIGDAFFLKLERAVEPDGQGFLRDNARSDQYGNLQGSPLLCTTLPV